MLTTENRAPAAAPAMGAEGAPRAGTYVTFMLAGQTFGVSVADVREILDVQAISRLPNASPDCEGVIDTRGQSIPMIDLGQRLGVHRGEQSPETRIIVFEVTVAGARRPIGVIADRVLNVIQITDEVTEPTPPAALRGGSARGLRGLARVSGSLVVLLDVADLFDADDRMLF